VADGVGLARRDQRNRLTRYFDRDIDQRRASDGLAQIRVMVRFLNATRTRMYRPWTGKDPKASRPRLEEWLGRSSGSGAE
jgi:hypothetical protein